MRITALANLLHRALLGGLLVALPLSSSFAQTNPATYTDSVTGMEFVLIEGGSFTMGNNARRIASPERKVSLPAFYMGKYEVTFAQYDLFCQETGRQKPSDNGWGRGQRPVININWHEAVSFALWLKKKTGLGYRLPSESEWEYANRARTTTKYWWGEQADSTMAHYQTAQSTSDSQKSSPAGTYPANPWALFDTLGNVLEWTLDNIHRNYEGAPTDGSAWYQGGSSNRKMVRGGSFNLRSNNITSSRREWQAKHKGRADIGFRLVLDGPLLAATNQ